MIFNLGAGGPGFACQQALRRPRLQSFGEYLPVMDPVDRFLLDSLNINGRSPRVVCLPTAAGQEGEDSIGRWSRMGVEHFHNLGADVKALHVIDRQSAEDPRWDSDLVNADIIYFSGGDPVYLFKTLHGSRFWRAANQAWDKGAVFVGCSAGAMILAEQVPNIRTAGLRHVDAFGILPAKTVIPHFDRMKSWAPLYMGLLRSRMKTQEYVLGIDENTALVGKLEDQWQVMGEQTVSVITRDKIDVYRSGDWLQLTAGAE